MSNEFLWFDKEETEFTSRFYRFQHLLVSNKSKSRMESILLLVLFYSQILAGFFDPNIGVLQGDISNSDYFLTLIHNIIRGKGLLIQDYSAFKYVIYLIFLKIVFSTILYITLLLKCKHDSNYTYREFVINFIIKIFLFALFNPILDLTLTNLCFETYNPNFVGVTCNISDNISIFIVSFILLFYSIFLSFFLNKFNNDSYFLSNSLYSRMNCNYEIFISINCFFSTILLSQVKYLGNEIFLVYNCIVSLIFLKFFFGKFLYYDQTTNAIVGIFHIIYTWTSLFFFVFAFVNVDEKAVIYIIGCVIVLILFFNLRNRLYEHILFNTPFHKIENKYHLMFYLKVIIDKIQNMESNLEDKTFLVGIIQHHQVECPSPSCITKHKEKRIYLPITDEWSNRDKPEINDKVFMLNLIIIIMNYFFEFNFYCPEMLINLSMYYLQILGNYCQAIFYYNKVKEMKLSMEDNFSLIRLNFAIRKTLVEKLHLPNEGCPNLEDLNVTYYFKYDDLSKNFFEEINNDINLSLEFWKCFKTHHESGRALDFNKVFKLTDKIRVSKNKVEKIWNEMFNTYSGVNELFELYQNYIEQINDDDMLSRELEAVKIKNIISSDQYQFNYYNLLFNKDTGIVILNGSKNKEGILEKVNEFVEKAFGYKNDEVKGLNVTFLMPKMFEKIHNSFLTRFVETGEKKRIDKSSFRSYAKDKDNCLICMKFLVKLFPMLNTNIYYCGLAIKENIDDFILIDSRFNIQGMTKKLMTKFELDNKEIFSICEIPLYIICKKFINFYKFFINKNKRRHRNENRLESKLLSGSINNSIYLSRTMSSTKLIKISENDEFSDKENSDNNLKKINEIIQDEYKEILGNENINQNESNQKENKFDIDENIELEYEICIPQFLNDYLTSITHKNRNSSKKLLKSDIHDDTKSRVQFKIEIDGKDYEEDDNLVDNELVGEDGEETGIKQTDEEKEFHSKIHQYRSLFETGKYTELEQFIDRQNYETNYKEIKFNFTFEKYKYGDDNYAFIVRCIDNRADFELSRSDVSIEANEADKERHQVQQSAKVDALKIIQNISAEDKYEIEHMIDDYFRLSLEDRDLNNIMKKFKDEIICSSKIFGFKNEEKIDEENSSQSSATGFNDNIAKKSRIEEIKSNIMHNIPNFYTLKWIKGIFYFIILITAAFCGLYLMVFDMIYKDLVNISTLNIGLYQSTIWTLNIISTLISLKSSFEFNLNNSSISINSYIPDEINYFKSLKGFTSNWYYDVISTFGPMEQQINLYFNNADGYDLLSKNGAISYPLNNFNLNDTESVSMLLDLVLSNTNSLLLNPYFSNNINASSLARFSSHNKDHMVYSCFMSIENAIDNLIPKLFDVLKVAPGVFTTQNNSNMNFVILIILLYTFTIMFLIFLYTILLYLTNKNMEDGLEKVSKIKVEKIDETIKKIENFNEKCLSRHRQRDSKFVLEELKDLNVNNNNLMNNDIDNQIKDYAKIFSEGQTYKRLEVLSNSYFQIIFILIICCVILTPIYVISLNVIDSSNKILSVQNYIFGMLLTSSASIVKIKCTISQCKTVNPQNFTVAVQDRSLIEATIRGLTSFPDLNDFYSNKFLLNACAAIFDPINNSTPYNACMGDIIIVSANNTDSLLSLITETVATIIKDEEMKTNMPQLLQNGSTVMFTPPLLYESSNFRNLEYIFYNYITPVSDSFSTIISYSLDTYLLSTRIKIIILIGVFVASILVFSYYIMFIFTKVLIHLLSVARVILRIIPTVVINNTQDLEVWMENKY